MTKRLIMIMVGYVALCGVYFSNIHLPSKLAYPVAMLGIVALAEGRRMGWLMPIGLVCSALGDLQGTLGNFLGQMGCFGLAHVAYIGYFVKRRPSGLNTKQGALGAIPCVLLGIVAFALIVPHAPQGIVQTGVGIYCVLILTMLWAALQQHNGWFGWGAALFVASDFILAWNKFVEPIDGASWLIMVPYYGAQGLLYMRATTAARGGDSCSAPGR